MVKMAENVREMRPRGPDSEKITINLGYVDLGHVDLLVREGFYSNRTDFIRTAIRKQLGTRHGDALKRSATRMSLDLGLRHYTREDPRRRAAGRTLRINVLGLASIARDVTPELARATIESVSVLGGARQPGREGRPGRPHRLTPRTTARTHGLPHRASGPLP